MSTSVLQKAITVGIAGARGESAADIARRTGIVPSNFTDTQFAALAASGAGSQALTDLMDELGLTTVSYNARLDERPGDNPERFSDTLYSGGEGAATTKTASVVTNGTALLMAGAGIAARRALTGIEPNRVYRARMTVLRTVDPPDPNNDAVELRLAWFDNTKTQLAGGSASTLGHRFSALTVAAGLQGISVDIGTAVSAPGIVPPSGAEYLEVYAQSYGVGGTTALIALDIEDITDTGQALPSDIVTQVQTAAADASASATAAAASASSAIAALATLGAAAFNQNVAKSVVSSVPGSPSAGDIYLLSHAAGSHPDELAYYSGSAWVYSGTPQKGWFCYVQDVDQEKKYTGAAWKVRKSALVFASDFVDVAAADAYNVAGPNKKLIVDEDYALTGNLTLSSPAVGFNDGIITTGAHTLTFSGRVIAELNEQLFDKAGTGLISMPKNGMVSVAWYGTTADATTDDSHPFQRALATTGARGGGLVEVPYSSAGYKIGTGSNVAGDYGIAGTTLAIPTNTTLRGDKRVKIICGALGDDISAPGRPLLFYLNNVTGSRITGITPDGQGTSSTDASYMCFLFDGVVKDCMLDDFHATNFVNFAIGKGSNGHTDPALYYFDGLVLDNFIIDGFTALSGAGSAIDFFERASSGSDPVCTGLRISNGLIDVSNGSSDVTKHGPQCIKLSNMRGVVLDNLRLKGGSSTSLFITNGTQSVFVRGVRSTLSSRGMIVKTSAQKQTARTRDIIIESYDCDLVGATNGVKEAIRLDGAIHGLTLGKIKVRNGHLMIGSNWASDALLTDGLGVQGKRWVFDDVSIVNGNFTIDDGQQEIDITVAGTATAGNTITLSAQSNSISYTVQGGDDAAAIAAQLARRMSGDVQKFTIGGTATTGDSIQILFIDQSGNATGVFINVTTGQTTAQMAANLQAAIAADPTVGGFGTFLNGSALSIELDEDWVAGAKVLGAGQTETVAQNVPFNHIRSTVVSGATIKVYALLDVVVTSSLSVGATETVTVTVPAGGQPPLLGLDVYSLKTQNVSGSTNGRVELEPTGWSLDRPRFRNVDMNLPSPPCLFANSTNGLFDRIHITDGNPANTVSSSAVQDFGAGNTYGQIICDGTANNIAFWFKKASGGGLNAAVLSVGGSVSSTAGFSLDTVANIGYITGGISVESAEHALGSAFDETLGTFPGRDHYILGAHTYYTAPKSVATTLTMGNKGSATAYLNAATASTQAQDDIVSAQGTISARKIAAGDRLRFGGSAAGDGSVKRKVWLAPLAS